MSKNLAKMLKKSKTTRSTTSSFEKFLTSYNKTQLISLFAKNTIRRTKR